MAISRSLMNRQLRADGGIMQVAPREKFGLGSKLKKFVRKIIPNEVSEIAVKAAPFVAPFNPLLAAGMSGIGSFDQTGRIGDSLKSGALTYGLGQGARYLGGAGFQKGINPFQGADFSGGIMSGIKSLGSSPFGSETGFGKMLSDKAAAKGQLLKAEGTQPIQGVGDNVIIPKQKPTNILAEQMSEVSLDPSGAIIDTASSTVTTPGSAMESLKSVVSFETSAADKGKAALDLLKRGSKSLFYTDGKPDKAAILGAVTAAASYAEALMLAKDAGVELTEEEYDQAQRDEKKEEYAGYLQNFFGGKKDGGRIGFESGANEMIKTQLLEEIMPNTDTTTEDYVIIMTEDGPRMILKSNLPSESMMMDTTTSVFGDAGRGREIPQELRADGGRIGFKKGSDPVYEMYLEDLEAGIIPSDKSYNEYLDDIEDDPDYDYSYAKGGRVSRKFGSPEEGESEIGIMAIDVEAGDDEDEEDMMMAGGITFSSAEKSYLFRRLGGSGGSDRSFTMPQLYGILNNPNSPSNINDAKVLKEIAIMGLGKGQKDGGRIGFADGTPDKMEQYKKYVSDMIKDGETPVDFEEFLEMTNYKDGGRIGYKKGANRVSELLILRDNLLANGEDVSDIEAEIFQLTGKTFKSVGGISDIPTGKIKKNSAGVVERDYRDEGGFVPVGIKERADDVPAMLSKNEFVMTADAVRGIGNGSVEEGSKKLYNTMKKAEQVGKA
jgi:hypothetical protein